MARKTYVPMAIYWANGLHKRLTKYQETLIQEKSVDQIAALADLIVCLANFINRWNKPPPGP